MFAEDPDVKLLAQSLGDGWDAGAHPRVLRRAAEGRTPTGGLLHPLSGNVAWSAATASSPAYVTAASAAAYHYRAYCVAAAADPEPFVDTALALAYCGTRSEESLARFKLAYDWTGDWHSDDGVAAAARGQPALWTNRLGEFDDAPVWQQAQQLVLAADPLFCFDACNWQDYTSNKVRASVRLRRSLCLGYCFAAGRGPSCALFFLLTHWCAFCGRVLSPSPAWCFHSQRHARTTSSTSRANG